MKKKKSLIVVVLSLVLLTSGCTKYLSGEDKKRVVNEETGQIVTSNILCLPESKNLLDIYNDNKERMEVDYDSLKSCKDFSPSDIKYKSLWETIFIKPLAWLIIQLGELVGNYGCSVMLLGIAIRLILIPFTKKSLMQSENMKKAQPELQAIQNKYKNMQGQGVQMQMSQEMMMIYRKYDINPAAGCLTAFLQLPILLAFYEAINRVPAIFEGELFSLQLGTSPSIGISKGNMLYLLVIVLIVLSTYFSYKNTMNTSMSGTNQDSQSNMTIKIMIGLISVISLTLPTALALYWIVSNGFMIVQNYILLKGKDKNKTRVKVKKGK